MGYIVSGTLMVVFAIEYRNQKCLVAPSVIFSAFWMIVTFAAALQLYNLNSAKSKTWMIILLGVVSFVLGTKIKFRKHITLSIDYEKDRHNCYIPNKVFWSLFAVVGSYRALILYQTIKLMQSNISLGFIRDASFGIYIIEGYSYINSFLLRHLVSAIDTILIATGIECFLRDQKRNKLQVIAATFLAVGEAISAGGRWILIYFAVEFFVCFCLFRRNNAVNKIVKSTKFKSNGILFSVLIMAALFVAFSQVNTGRSIKNLGGHLYAYLCGCVPLLDLKVASIDRNGMLSYIFAGLYGLWSFVIPPFESMTGISIPIFDDTVRYVMTGQEVLNIGWGDYNAFTTCFYYLYADFRYIGVFMGMFVFGIIAQNIFEGARLNNNAYMVVPYLIVSQMMIKSIQTYAFGSRDYMVVWAIIIIVYITKRYRFKIN